MLSHANLMAAALGALSTGQFLEPRGRLLHSAPMFHLATIRLAGRNLVGGTHVILPGFTPRGRRRRRGALPDHRYVPGAHHDPDARRLAAAAQHDLFQPQASDLRRLADLQAVLERALRPASAAKLLQAYGMTELAPTTTVLTGGSPGSRAAALGRPGGAHRRGEDRRRETTTRCHAAPSVRCAPGSARDARLLEPAEETAAALRGGWMHTGGRRVPGRQRLPGHRRPHQDMIVTGGENVYSAEEENALAQHPSVATLR
jgi:acyl-CoA synthetase (AMP-forming)/AMP-acid ligase II